MNVEPSTEGDNQVHEDQEIGEPASLAQILVGHRGGLTEQLLSKMLHEVTQGVKSENKTGRLKLTVHIKPLTDDASNVAVTIEGEAFTPKPGATPAIMYIGDDGVLSQTDPYRIPMFDVPAVKS